MCGRVNTRRKKLVGKDRYGKTGSQPVLMAGKPLVSIPSAEASDSRLDHSTLQSSRVRPVSNVIKFTQFCCYIHLIVSFLLIDPFVFYTVGVRSTGSMMKKIMV